MEVNEARRLKELERENTELKKMLAEEMLKNRVLSYVCEKSCEPGPAPGIRAGSREPDPVFATASVPVSEAGAFDVQLSWPPTDARRGTIKETADGTIGGTSSLWYRRIAALLRREGWRVGKRHIQRLRRDAGLRVPPTKRKIVRRGVSAGLPTTATHRNHVWTWDFIADRRCVVGR